ncbi:MAG: DUF481 domain-containing protein [Bacteroidales bacterium]|nr:DUF481 domain-containing protein [Bacteroidales bacterium]
MKKTLQKNIINISFILSFILLPLLSFAGPKTDTVYLYNGDRITGEVKRFEYGILVFKTDGMGTLNIEYDRIRTVYSKQKFTILLANGLRFFGSIDTSHTSGHVNIHSGSFRIPEPISAIVEIFPVKNVFWKRLDGAIDLGYSYTKASTISKLNFSGNVDYRVQKSFSQIKISSTFTDQKDRDRIRKQDYYISHRRFFKRRWFAGALLGMQQNTELGNNHRIYFGLGLGNDVVHSNSQVLSGAMGLLLVTEKSEADSTIQSIEGMMQWNYRVFKFNKPEIELTSFFNAYPSFTTWGRVRLEFEIKARIELFNDFYFGLSLYDNYDSQPLDNTAATNDWGITTSIGYSW